jgi:hypothetical protein
MPRAVRKGTLLRLSVVSRSDVRKLIRLAEAGARQLADHGGRLCEKKAGKGAGFRMDRDDSQRPSCENGSRQN